MICTALAAVIFAVDLHTPLGFAGGVPYVLLILIALWDNNKLFAVKLAVICTLLTLLGFFYSPAGGDFFNGVLNRLVTLSAIWLTTTFVWASKAHEEKLFTIRNEIEKQKIYLATIHGAQHIINNLLNQLILIQLKAHSGEKLDERTLEIFDGVLAEAKALMEELSAVDQIDEEKIKQSVYDRILPHAREYTNNNTNALFQ